MLQGDVDNKRGFSPAPVCYRRVLSLAFVWIRTTSRPGWAEAILLACLYKPFDQSSQEPDPSPFHHCQASVVEHISDILSSVVVMKSRKSVTPAEPPQIRNDSISVKTQPSFQMSLASRYTAEGLWNLSALEALDS